MIFIITIKDVNKTIKEFLLENTISRKSLKNIKAKGKIEVNGVHQTVRYLLQEEDCLKVTFGKEESSMVVTKIPLDIYYEDDDFLIINKPSHLPCIPTRRHPSNTLANGLMYYYQKHHIDATVHLINRLDKDTQGLLLVAKSRYMHSLLSKDNTQIERVYHCIVEGQLEGSGTIETGISKTKDSMIRYVDPQGKRAITKYRVLKSSSITSLVECRLVTGRTHQIRVHMQYLNHPLLGDNMYGSTSNTTYYLDSIALSFIHPITNKKIEIKKEPRVP